MIIAPRTKANILDSNIDEEEAGIAVYDSSKDDYTTGDLVQVKAPYYRKYEAIQAVPKGDDNALNLVFPTVMF